MWGEGEQVLTVSSSGVLIHLGHLKYITVCHIRREMHRLQLGNAGLGRHNWGGRLGGYILNRLTRESYDCSDTNK